MSMRDQMEAAEDRAIAARSLRRDYEARTPLTVYLVASGKKHLGRPAFARSGYVVLACSGRAVRGAVPISGRPSCKVCEGKP